MKTILKRISIGLAILACLLLSAVTLVYVVSNKRLNRKHTIPPLPEITISSDSTILARGQHLVSSTANCAFCHGSDLGGSIYIDGALGTIVGSNLTRGRGGIGADFTDADWIRSIRHGIRRDSTSMLIMPSEVFVNMSIEDLSAVISYLKQLPPVDRELPSTSIGFLGRALFATGKASILVAEKTPHQKPIIPSTPQKYTLEYGRYLADVSACRGCHGQNLSGGMVAGPPGTPPTSNLTPAGRIKLWSEKEFIQALRTGKRPDGTIIDEFMPWRSAGKMTDHELHAIWLYLKSVPPMETGNR